MISRLTAGSMCGLPAKAVRQSWYPKTIRLLLQHKWKYAYRHLSGIPHHHNSPIHLSSKKINMWSITVIKIQSGNNSNSLGCLIFDDSMLPKTGRYIEKISRMFDHVSKRYILGYKLLMMGYWDGASLIPLDFSLHRERGSNKDKPYGLKKKEYRKQFSKRGDSGTHSWDRVREADVTKIEWISTIQEEETLSEVEKIQKEKADWWEKVSRKDKKAIEEGIDQLDHGELPGNRWKLQTLRSVFFSRSIHLINNILINNIKYYPQIYYL